MIGLLVSGLLAGTFWRWRRRRVDARRRRAVELDGLVDLTDELIRGVRSGLSLGAAFTGALEEAHRTNHVPGLVPVRASLRAGRRLGTSLHAVAGADPRSPLALVAAAILVLIESGGPAGDGLERLAETLRSTRAAAAGRRSRAAHAAASAGMLGILPVLAATVLAVGSTAGRRVYDSPLGWVCLVAMVALTLSGQAWMDLAIWGRGKDLP